MPVERAKFWRVGDLELLCARYVTHSFAPHTHDGYAIGVIRDGTERFRYRGASHDAVRGAVVLVNPAEVHTGHAATPSGWEYRMFYPEVSLLERAANELGLRGTPFFPEPVVNDPELARRLLNAHAILENASSQLERDAVLLGALQVLISKHAEHRPAMTNNLNDLSAVRMVRDHLEANFAENTSLEELSQLSGLSGFHLTRAFKRTCGLPPHALQTQLRVRDARRHLLEGKPIAQAALEAGFSDQSHLTRCFKRLYGVAPGAYLKGSTQERSRQTGPGNRRLTR